MALKKIMFLFGLALLLSLAAGSVAFAAARTAAAPANNVGIVDNTQVINSHPKLSSVRQQLANISRQKENEARTAADKETDNAKKAQVVQAKRMELAQEEQKLMEPIFRDCEQAVRVVAKNKNLNLVLSAAMVLYGGVDITQDVIQQLTKSVK